MTHLNQVWDQLGGDPMSSRFYRKQEVYTMAWYDIADPDTMDLSHYIVALAPLAGPVAVTRDRTQMLEVRGKAGRPTVQIYSPAGALLTTIPWEGGGIVALGWTAAEQVVVLQDDGTVHLYTVTGEFERSFSMGQAARDYGIAGVEFTADGRGMAVLTNDNRIFSVSSFANPRPRHLHDVPGVGGGGAGGLDEEGGGAGGVTAFTILSNDRGVEVLVAANEKLFVIDANDAWPVLSDAQLITYVSLTVSPNGRLVAMFTSDGKISVVSSDFQANKMEFDFETRVPPRQLEWCGQDSVVAYWDQLGQGTDTLVMVGPGGKCKSYSYMSRVVLRQEVDGLRIVGQESHEFLQVVPPAIQSIFMIGSMSPAAMLYDARDHYDKRSPRADDLIRDIKDNPDMPDALPQAIAECVEAAGQESDTGLQQSLLRAARFGMDFIDVPRGDYIEMCRYLRVLFHVRDYEVAIPLTMRQFRELTVEVLVDRLIARGIYWLAYEICKFLKLEGTQATSRVLVHWASSMIRNTAAEDEVVADTIIEKLRDTRGISFAEIASAAAGRPELAIRLLNQETRPSAQVPLLLDMNEQALALEKAVASGDTDLVHLVVVRLRDSMGSSGDFNRMIDTRPEARDLYINYCREADPKALRQFYYQLDRFADGAALCVSRAYDEAESLEEQLASLKEAAKLYSQGRKDGSAKSTEDQVNLLAFQKNMERALKVPCVNMPLGDTISTCVLKGDMDRAAALKKQFKVPDKRFWWLKVRALAQARNWLELERFAKSKKSPIGYEPFVDECISMSNRAEAKKYCARVSAERRVPCFIKVGDYESAVLAAAQQKNEEAFEAIAKAAGNRRDVLRLIEEHRPR
eukprot:UC1_evm5s1915